MWRTIIFVVIAAAVLYVGYQYQPQLTSDGGSDNSSQTTTVTELQIEDTTVGTGREAKAGNTVSVHYVGTLTNGTKFDSSRDRGEPFSFTLGQNSVIQGWEKGILGMKIGGKRKLIIPPDLAYGSQAMGPIPANSTLVFEVELLDVK